MYYFSMSDSPNLPNTSLFLKEAKTGETLTVQTLKEAVEVGLDCRCAIYTNWNGMFVLLGTFNSGMIAKRMQEIEATFRKMENPG